MARAATKTAGPRVRACKIGTVPALVILRHDVEPQVGQHITFRRTEDGARWQEGDVDAVNADGYFFVSLR